MIGIVILNYSTYQQTIELVEALQKQTLIDQIKIVIVDNDSPNDSYKRLKPLEVKFSNVVVLKTDENLGYAKGNNYGLHYLEREVKPEYMAILNNDVILKNDCVEHLIEKCTKLDKPGVIAPVMTDTEGNRQLSGDLSGTWDDLKILFALYNKLHKSEEIIEKDTTGIAAMKVDLIWGSFMFGRLETFKDMGYFYPNTFLYVEERFVADAARRRGYNNYIVLDHEYIHAHNSPTISSYHNTVSKYKMLYESRLEYIRICRKHGKVKAFLIKPFMMYSLLEWRIIGYFKSLANN